MKHLMAFYAAHKDRMTFAQAMVAAKRTYKRKQQKGSGKFALQVQPVGTIYQKGKGVLDSKFVDTPMLKEYRRRKYGLAAK
jgi:hypothetical protein